MSSLISSYNYVNNLTASFYSEPLFCSLGIVPFVTALVIGGLTLCGTTFTTIFIDKVQYSHAHALLHIRLSPAKSMVLSKNLIQLLLFI